MKENIHMDDSCCFSDRDDTSFMSRDIELKMDKKILHNLKQYRKPRKIEITNAKHFPTYFFVLFIVVLTVLLFKFVPDFYGVTNRDFRINNLIKKKYSIKYFSEFLGGLDVFTKLVLIISQILLFAIVVSLSSTFKRTQEKPGNNFLQSKTANNFLVNILCSISVVSLIGLTFYPEYFVHLSVSLRLVDNVLFPIMMLSSFFLTLILNREIKNNFRDLSIILMAIQTVLYTLSIMLVSYYSPVTKFEKFLQFILLICINSNSVMFLLTFTFYVLSLQYALSDKEVTLNLEYNQNSNSEYYIDIDQDNKNVL